MKAQLAYVGLGANLGDPVAQLAAAVGALADLPGGRLLACSPLYRSVPQGGGPQPDYVNAACALATTLAPRALLAVLQDLEAAAGRRRDGRPDRPRPLDLDLLCYGRMTLDEADLVLPHPRLHRREFVLRPLADIAPALEIPGRGRVAALLAAVAGQGVEPLGEPADWPVPVIARGP